MSTTEQSSSSSSSNSYSMANGGFIDSETLKTSEQQQEVIMPSFNGRIVEWFHKAGDRVSKGEAILCVESRETAKDGFRVNMDIPAPQNGYLAARYKLEGDTVDANHVLAVLVPDQESLASFAPQTSSNSGSSSPGGGGGKSWWATPYEPGRPDPFTAKSPLDDDDDENDGGGSIVPNFISERSDSNTNSPTIVQTFAGLSTDGDDPRKMIEIAPSPSDPFGFGEDYSSGPSISSPNPSRVTTKTAAMNDYGSQEARPPSSMMDEERYERRRRNNNREHHVQSVTAVPYNEEEEVTYANADAARRPKSTDQLKSAAVPTPTVYGSNVQSSISSDDSRVRYAGSSNPRQSPRYSNDANVVSSSSYGSNEQSSIPAKTVPFFQQPAKRRRRRKIKNRKQRPSSLEADAYDSRMDDEDPSIQSVVFPSQQSSSSSRNSLPSQSGGSMSLSDNTLPTRSNLDSSSGRVSRQESRAFVFQSEEDANTVAGMDFVDFLEERGLRDAAQRYNNNNNMPQQPPPIQQSQLQWQQREPKMANPAYRNSIITRAPNRTPPTDYDIAASALGGTLLGASIGIAGVLYPELGLGVGQSVLIPPVLWATMIGTVGYAGGIADNDAGYSIRHVFSLGRTLQSSLKKLVHSARETVEKTANEALRMVSGKEEPPVRVHHVTIKTKDIVSAMEFYSLFGFESKSKFRIGQARAIWLDNVVVGAGRIELIEVPSDMLEQGEESARRALDQELLGWNHMTLDVSDYIRKKRFGSLSELLAYLNDKSYQQFGKGLRLAVEPQKQAIDSTIYDTALLYDPDGSLIQLQYRTNERVEDYRLSLGYYTEPTGGQGLVDQSDTYQCWW